jgi:uncharacterized protein YciI
MHYVLFYEASSDYAEKRSQFRNLHLNLARAAYDRGELVLGGAMADPIDGAMLIFRGPSADAAEAFAKADPYVINGLVTKWSVRKWNAVVGDGTTV